MPLELTRGYPTLLIRRSAFERAGLTRNAFDERLGLTPDEFRVERGLIAIGPIVEDGAVEAILSELESLGLSYYDDFFDLSGNWPEWLALFAMEARTASDG